MKTIQKILVGLFVLTVLSMPVQSFAQCAMCKAAVEAGMGEDGQEKIGSGLNKGILYLMSIPYIMGAVIGIAYFRNRKKLVDF